jgi:hypothetical protein
LDGELMGSTISTYNLCVRKIMRVGPHIRSTLMLKHHQKAYFMVCLDLK